MVVKTNVKLVGVSKEFSMCRKCLKRTQTIVRLVDGKKLCVCMSCLARKGDPQSITRY